MRLSTAITAAVLLAAAAPAIAQEDITTEIEVGDDDGENSNSRLELLGLLGLAGMLGLRRREPDIYVDARRGPAG